MAWDESIFLKNLQPEEFKLVQKLRKQSAALMHEYHLLAPNDKVMVCLSGGKDSYTMLDLLLYHQKKAPFHFEIVAVNMDQKQPGFPAEVLPTYLEALGVEYRIVEKDTYSVVKSLVPEGKTMCSLCSRLRRGTLYGIAEELGATKIALGHHKDDTLETFFLNLFFAGKIEAMPPIFQSDDRKHTVIRPLLGCREKDIAVYAQLRQFPIIPCTLCGSQENMQRKNIKKMLAEWDEQFPNRSEIMFTALQHVHPSHVLDKNLFDFEHLQPKTAQIAGNVPLEEYF